MYGRPECEIVFSERLLRDLLVSQHPDLAELPISHVGSGWDNEVYRLGDNLALRMPRREVAAALALNEQRWLPRLASFLPVSVPAPLRVGVADENYPWPWTVVPWFFGTEADRATLGSGSVNGFVAFLRALHAITLQDAPVNPHRSGPVSAQETTFRQRVARLRASTDVITPALMQLWEEGLSAPVVSRECWLHADLHAQNVLVNEGSIEAVIDWGDMARGDPATDLAAVWCLYRERSDREQVLNTYGADDAMVLRARAWAAISALVLIESGVRSSPRHERQGRTKLSRLLADV